MHPDSSTTPVLGRIGLALLGAAVLFGAAACPATAQDESVRWQVDSDPMVDLWFHGMGLVGVQGPGGAPFYSASYPTEIRAAKERMGVGTTPLDAALPELRAGIARGGELELLHFLPLYFPGVSRTGLLQAVEAIAEAGDGPPSVTERAAEFGATAIASIITDPEQRALIGRFARALDQEWDLFLSRHRQEMSVDLAPLLAASGRRLNDELLPPVAPFLRRFGLQAGRLMVSPGIGREGRILAGDPANPWDNQVVVGLGNLAGSTDPGVDFFARLLKEACYPAVREAMSRAQISGLDPAAGERLSSDAATRCGAMVLDRYAPALSPEYRVRSVAAVSGQGSRDPGVFTQAFPLPPGLERALLEVVEAGS